MPCARDIKRRILSVKSTQQTTRAMKMISAAKLYKVQKRVLAAKPYAQALLEVFGKLAKEDWPEQALPLLQPREVHRTLVIVITANRGLAGSFNRSLIQLAQSLSADNTQFLALGKKGREALPAQELVHPVDVCHISDRVLPEEVEKIVNFIISAYIRRQWDCVKVVYQAFLSVSQQQPVVQTLLPLNTELFLLNNESKESLAKKEPQWDAENQWDDPDEWNMTEEANETEQNLEISSMLEPESHEDAGDLDDDWEAWASEASLQKKGELQNQDGYLFEGEKQQILEALSYSYVSSVMLQAFMECKASEHIARMKTMSTATDNAGELIKQLQMDYNRSRQAAITREIAEISSGAHALS